MRRCPAQVLTLSPSSSIHPLFHTFTSFQDSAKDQSFRSQRCQTCFNLATTLFFCPDLTFPLTFTQIFHFFSTTSIAEICLHLVFLSSHGQISQPLSQINIAAQSHCSTASHSIPIYWILVEKMRELSLLIFTKLLSVVHSPAKALSASQQGQQACQPLPQALSCPCRNPQVPTYPPPPPQPGWYLPHPVLQTSWTWKQLEQGESSSRHWCQCAWRGLYSTSQGKRRQPPHLCLPPCWLAPAWRGHSSAWSHSIPRGHETFWKGPPGVQFSSGHKLWGPTDQSSSDPTTQPPP